MGLRTTRRGYLDWLRGVAVLIMIEAHVIDAWTSVADRTGRGFTDAVILGGFGAPLFLYLAGVAVVLAAESKRRRLGSEAAAAAAVGRRGLEIFVLALLFRIQAYVLSPGARLRGILKVDILNIMGPSMVLAAVIWQRGRTQKGRLTALGVATIAVAMVTPVIRAASWPAALPDPLEWYLRPAPGMTTFTLFPWSGFLLAGAFVGVLIEAPRDRRQESRLMSWLAIGAATLTAAAYWTSFLPSIYARSSFWTSSPTFFFLRVGVLTMVVPVAWLRTERRSRGEQVQRWSPIEEFGRSSLFVYWIHVEMVYGIVSTPLHRQLPLAGAVGACLVFALFLFGLVRLKNRFVNRWREPRASGPVAGPVCGNLKGP